MEVWTGKVGISSTIAWCLVLIFSNFGEGSTLPEPTSKQGGSGPSSSSSSSTPHQTHHYNYHPHYHRCYVCLPPDRSSTIAREILSTFPEQNITDCSYFDSQTNVNLNPHTQFIFSCPMNYSGCLLRTHGSSVSRTCAHYPINDCKSANSIELCYCTGSLCNKDRSKFSAQHISLSAHASELANNGLFEEGETDDEDLLGPFDKGSGAGAGHGPDQSTLSSGSDPIHHNHDNDPDHGHQTNSVSVDHSKSIPTNHNRDSHDKAKTAAAAAANNCQPFSLRILFFSVTALLLLGERLRLR